MILLDGLTDPSLWQVWSTICAIILSMLRVLSMGCDKIYRLTWCIASFMTNLWQYGMRFSTNWWSPVALINTNLKSGDFCMAAKVNAKT